MDSKELEKYEIFGIDFKMKLLHLEHPLGDNFIKKSKEQGITLRGYSWEEYRLSEDLIEKILKLIKIETLEFRKGDVY